MKGIEIQERIKEFLGLEEGEFYLGIFAADEFTVALKRAKGLKRSFWVLNTQTSSNPGQHWWACFRSSRRGSPDHYEAFDSLGLTETVARQRLGRRVRHCVYNSSRVQGSSDSCGKYVAYYCVSRVLNWTDSFEECFAGCFTGDTSLNEAIVNRFWTTGRLFHNDEQL
jgi:hypothetical protein